MRSALLTIAALAVASSGARADIPPETITNSTMDQPRPSWFIVNNSADPAYIFDADDGQMKGLLALSAYTPAVQPNLSRGEIYAAESYYSRGVRGERTDILAIYDMATLTPKAEVVIPQKYEPSFFQRNIGLLGDNRHVVVFNMTPGQSVSIVDIVKRQFVGEISTPGCSTIMPVGEASFLMICGDGSLQLIRLDDDGGESSRERSRKFFSVEDDPIGDRPVMTETGWMFQSFAGLIYEATVRRGKPVVTKPWSLLRDGDAAEGWRIGSSQPMDYHPGRDLLFTLMHIGDVDSRDDPATEVWVFNRQQQRRLFRIELTKPATSVLVTKEEQPKLLLLSSDDTVAVYDALQLKPLATITEVGPAANTLQSF